MTFLFRTLFCLVVVCAMLIILGAVFAVHILGAVLHTPLAAWPLLLLFRVFFH